jgi:hypothetical protein
MLLIYFVPAPGEQNVAPATMTRALDLPVEPSATSQPTSTSTLTNTPVPTITPTFTPESLTATKAAKETQVAQTVAAITATANAKIAIRTETALAKSIQATRVAQYATIDLKELLTYPDNHTGELIVIRGRIFNIDGKVVQIYVRSYDAVYIEMEDPVSGIYENDYITVYGEVYGSYCFNNTLGNQVCQPGIYKAWYEKK